MGIDTLTLEGVEIFLIKIKKYGIIYSLSKNGRVLVVNNGWLVTIEVNVILFFFFLP